MFLLFLTLIPIVISLCWNRSTCASACETTCPGVIGCSCNSYCVNDCVSVYKPQVYNQPYQLTCVNATHTDPILIITPILRPYPLSYLYRNDSLILAKTDYMANINGSVCPYGCILNNGTCQGIYLPSGRRVICGYQKDWKCPSGCAHQKGTNECYPLTSNAICKFIPENMLCPAFCTFNYHLNKCISSDPNYVCEFSVAPLCPFGCVVNIRGDMCIPGVNEYSYLNNPYPICSQLSQPLCKTNCLYNSTVGYCKTYQTYSPCENLIIAQCNWPDFVPLQQRYATDVSKLTPCARNNAIDICYDPNSGIMYPERFKDKYAGFVKCAYSNLSCDNIGCRNSTCPSISTVCCGSR